MDKNFLETFVKKAEKETKACICICVDRDSNSLFCHLNGETRAVDEKFHLDMAMAVATIMNKMGNNGLGETLKCIGEVSQQMLKDANEQEEKEELKS